ncbi:MAG TPA: Holliday junction resolvase [Bacillota bacterium]|nr:Holliday junction resolvase [Bacillota bacterium]
MIEIPGRLPGLNEIIEAAKQGRGKYQPYAIMKEQYTSDIGWLAKKLPAYERVDITITWYEPNLRRDPDNITGGGTKFILDGLVAGGAIKDDSQRYVNSIKHIPELDRENPRVEIEVQEVEGDG